MVNFLHFAALRELIAVDGTLGALRGERFYDYDKDQDRMVEGHQLGFGPKLWVILPIALQPTRG